MTVTVSYPGVYIQELPSGSHSITGVATSITGFIGRAARGPINEALTINSLPDYTRTFGALDPASPMSFMVRDFYLNGGSQAVIVRMFKKDPANTTTATAIIDILDIHPTSVAKLVAANPGSWARTTSPGTGVTVEIDGDVADQMLTDLSPDPSDPTKKLTYGQVFNIKVQYGTAVELHRNVTMIKSSRQINKVLEAESDLVRWPPLTGHPDPLIGGPTPFTADDPSTFDSAVAGALVAQKGNPTPGDRLTSSATNPVQDGTWFEDTDFYSADPDTAAGFDIFNQADLVNLLVVPGTKPSTADPLVADTPGSVYAYANAWARKHRAVVLVDPPATWQTKKQAREGMAADPVTQLTNRDYAAIYWPRVGYANPFDDDRIHYYAPSGIIAGIIAQTDANRGVWKAPAGLEATVGGISELQYDLTDLENGELNPIGLNCLRIKPGAGFVVWGSRTVAGDDRVSSQWKYLPVRRTALFLEESLYRGTQWVVFEPNDEPLWSAIRTSLGAFMQGLFLQGAFQGQTPDEAYFVKCDEETTTQADIDNGIVNILVGFAPLKPAEFVVISLQQMAGQTAGG